MDMPSFFIEALERFPPGERHGIANAVSAVQNLDRFAGDFQNALRLFDFAGTQYEALEARRKEIDAAFGTIGDDMDRHKALFQEINQINAAQNLILSWRGIAARDAAMTVFHFGKQLALTNKIIATSPILDQSKCRAHSGAANDTFKAAFPFHERVRHSIGHAAEFQNDPDHTFSGHYEDEAIKVGGGSIYLGGALVNRALTITFEGDIYRSELSETSLSALRSVVDRFVAGVMAGCPARRTPDGQS